MLVLSRREGERIALDVPACPAGCCPARRVWVDAVLLDKHRVRLGIEAPADVLVTREELLAAPPRGGPAA